MSDKAFFQADAVNPIAGGASGGDEEFAAEVAAPYAGTMKERDARKRETAGESDVPRTSLGYVSFLVAVLSFFWLPGILGPIAAVVGFMAFVRGSRTLGTWSIVLGTVSFVGFLTTIPYNY